MLSTEQKDMKNLVPMEFQSTMWKVSSNTRKALLHFMIVVEWVALKSLFDGSRKMFEVYCGNETL